MDFKTETQYRQEISVVWGMNDQLKAENAALKDQVAQQAGAIRLNDAAIAWIQKRCAGEAMPNWENTPHTGHSRGLILDRTNHALAIQPSPEILQARDERVAEACAKVAAPKVGIRYDDYNLTIRNGTVKALRSGEWRKYL